MNRSMILCLGLDWQRERHVVAEGYRLISGIKCAYK